ncbi:alpha/beta fold hydrolase [Niabella beijingensis]|uniref:alpha/beta fold hydrolase n=1 Tax=Niabella beijingensis TaxID=2872700 RepID=UPI001CBF473D|nr:alpha/beta hydrolase [Niabella beijingensis]MBZ4188854.1 alpha/beta hydrolase [Niabella beijingensis]
MIFKNYFLVPALLTFVFSCSTKDRTITGPGNLVAKTVDQDPGLPAIQVNNSLLHSEAFGPAGATMIVALHGGPGADYRYLLPCKDLAARGYRVVFYDQRGSGLSQRFPKKSYTAPGAKAMDQLYDELNAVIEHYRTRPDQKVVLLGHSWGGMLASGFTGKYPGRVQGLIVCEPGGLQWKDVEHYVKDSRSMKLWSEVLNDAAYLDQFINGKEDQHEILDYKMSMLSSKNEITGEGAFDPTVSWRDGAVIMDALFDVGEKYNTDFSAGLNDFKKPVLFFYSEKNRAYPDSWAQRITAAYPSVSRVKVPGVGHDGIITNQKAWTGTTLPQILTYLSTLQ